MSLSRLRLTPGSHEVLDASKRGHDQLEPTESERIDAMAFVARGLVQIPDPRLHLVRYYGAYSNVARGKRRKAEAPPQPSVSSEASMAEPTPEGADRAALRRRWADLIRRVYEVDPLLCPRFGAEMRVVGFITQPAVIKRILHHLPKRELWAGLLTVAAVVFTA